MQAMFPTPQSSNSGKLKHILPLKPKKKQPLLKPISKQVPDTHSPTATSETCNPPRLKVVKTSKIAVFYNFYRFRGGLAPSQIPLKRKQRVCKTLYYPFLISANQCPHERNNFRCSSQLSGIPLRSLSKVNVSGCRFSQINFIMSGLFVLLKSTIKKFFQALSGFFFFTLILFFYTTVIYYEQRL